MTKTPFLPTGGTSDSFPQLQRGSLTSVGFAHEFCRYNQISIKHQLTRKRFQLCQADFFQTRLSRKVHPSDS